MSLVCECIYELLIFQVMNEILENGIHIYTGEIDEEDDSSEIRDLKVYTLDNLVCSFICFPFRSLCPFQ